MASSSASVGETLAPLRDGEPTTTLARARSTLEVRTSHGLSGSAKLEVDERATFADVVEVRLR